MPDENIVEKRESPSKGKPSDGQSDIDVYGFSEQMGQAVPKTGELPFNIQLPDNFSNKTDTVAKTLNYLKQAFLYFDSQEQRRDMMKDGGTMDIADRMWRVALRRDTSSSQYQNTLSDVASCLFRKQHRALHSNIKSILFDGKDLPAVFEPEITEDGLAAEIGAKVAKYHNMLEEMVFDEDKRKDKLGDQVLEYLLKYGMAIISDEWAYEERWINERKPIYHPVTGEVVGFNVQKVLKVVKNWPELQMHDIKNCWFDAQIQDFQEQRCFMVRKQVPYEYLVAQQDAGFFQNVEKIKATHFYDGTDDDVQRIRNENAGTAVTTEKNGLVEVWHCFARLPIDEKTGTWNTAKHLPQLYMITLAGRVDSNNVVCLRLTRNPYWDDEIPFKPIYCFQDDRGAYHISLAEILAPLYWEHTTILNQCFDNLTTNLRAPWITDGGLSCKDLKFSPAKLLKIDPGRTLTRLYVPDMTTIVMPMLEYIERDSNQTAGTDKPVLGQALGSRTTATESAQVLDQAILPIAQTAEYISRQMFDWIYNKDAMRLRQFGEPVLLREVTGHGEVVEVDPSILYGNLHVKVNAVGKYVNNVTFRMQLNSFVANIVPLFREYIGESGMRKLAREMFKIMGFDDVYEYVPETGDFDAYARAMETARKIIILKEYVEPMPEENHEVYLAVLNPYLAKYKNLPANEQDPNVLKNLQANIQLHKQMYQDSKVKALAGNVPPTGGGAQGETTPSLVGEAAGDTLGSQTQGGTV